MARARNIKPGFFTDAELIECEHWVRLLFAGLWTLADRDGRLLDKAKQIGVDLFPRETLDIDAGLAQLAEHGLIVRYDVDGQRIIWIKNFTNHQNPHKDERASILPPPPSIETHGANTVEAPFSYGATPADSPSLVTDSLIPDPGNPDDEPAAPAYSRFFEEFWSEWSTGFTKGRGVKKPAYENWKRWGLDKPGAAALRQAVLDGLAAWKACDQWQREGGRFVKHAERWLRDRGWESPPPGEETGVVRSTPKEARDYVAYYTDLISRIAAGKSSVGVSNLAPPARKALEDIGGIEAWNPERFAVAYEARAGS